MLQLKQPRSTCLSEPLYLTLTWLISEPAGDSTPVVESADGQGSNEDDDEEDDMDEDDSEDVCTIVNKTGLSA